MKFYLNYIIIISQIIIMICLKKDKYYIIPTHTWLKPLEPFITKDHNTEGNMMIAEAINKEKVIVKISNGYVPNIIKFNKLVKEFKLPNFVETYCSFRCYEDFSALDTNYDNYDGFCNGNDKKGDIVTLEIMKKYKHGSLEKYRNKLEYQVVVDIIKQVLLAQLMAFYHTQFIHNDFTLGNILLSTKPSIIKYTFLEDNIELNTINTVYISDFNKAKLLNEYYFNDKESYIKYFYKYHTLPHNLYNSFIHCLDLLKDKNIKEKIKSKLQKDNILNNILNLSMKDIRSKYKNYYEMDRFILEHTSRGVQVTNILYTALMLGDFVELVTRVLYDTE